MRILFLSPDIENRARGINMILGSLIDSAKNEGHDISLLVGYPNNKAVPESEMLSKKVEHLRLQHYMRDGKKSFTYIIKGGINPKNLLLAFFKGNMFRLSEMEIDKDLLSKKEPLLSNIDSIIRSPYIYQVIGFGPKPLIKFIIKRLSKRYGFDLIVVASPSRIRSTYVHGGKLAHFVHDTMPIDLIEAPPDNNTPGRYAKEFYSTCVNSDLILTNSKDTASKVSEVNPDANIHVLYGTASSRKKDVEPSSIVEAMGLKKGHYLLFASTIEKRKNVTTLLDAYAMISNKLDMPLVLVGGKGYGYKEIQNKYMTMSPKIRENVHFVGYVSESDKYALFDNAFAFVFPSVYEGIGLVIIEAMNTGIPVITSRRGALPEAGGDAALYVEDPYNPEEISNAIMHLVNNPEEVKHMVKRGNTNFEKFTHEKFQARFAKALESIS